MIQPRLAQMRDHEAIMTLIGHAQAYIKTFGIDQWQDGYPEPECIQADIEEQIGWVFDDDGRIAGYCVLLAGKEPIYDTICGKWLTSGDNYLTIHRMAIDDNWRGQGLSAQMIAFAEAFAGQKGLIAVRADTHTGNLAMRGLLEKKGFVHCGEVSYAGLVNHGDPIRVAYEKVLVLPDLNRLSWHASDEAQRQAIESFMAETGVDRLHFGPLGRLKECWENWALVLSDQDDETLCRHIDELFIWYQDLNWPGVQTIIARLRTLPRDRVQPAYDRTMAAAKALKDEEWLYFLQTEPPFNPA